MEITLQELKELEENQYELVDMRDEGELAYGTIPGAVHIPIENFDEIKDNDKKYVLFCTRGIKTKEIAESFPPDIQTAILSPSFTSSYSLMAFVNLLHICFLNFF